MHLIQLNQDDLVYLAGHSTDTGISTARTAINALVKQKDTTPSALKWIAVYTPWQEVAMKTVKEIIRQNPTDLLGILTMVMVGAKHKETAIFAAQAIIKDPHLTQQVLRGPAFSLSHPEIRLLAKNALKEKFWLETI